jgi:hypothetical protein
LLGRRRDGEICEDAVCGYCGFRSAASKMSSSGVFSGWTRWRGWRRFSSDSHLFVSLGVPSDLSHDTLKIHYEIVRRTHGVSHDDSLTRHNKRQNSRVSRTTRATAHPRRPPLIAHTSRHTALPNTRATPSCLHQRPIR